MPQICHFQRTAYNMLCWAIVVIHTTLSLYQVHYIEYTLQITMPVEVIIRASKWVTGRERLESKQP